MPMAFFVCFSDILLEKKKLLNKRETTFHGKGKWFCY